VINLATARSLLRFALPSRPGTGYFLATGGRLKVRNDCRAQRFIDKNGCSEKPTAQYERRDKSSNIFWEMGEEMIAR
jgi:hypothetical protein